MLTPGRQSCDSWLFLPRRALLCITWSEPGGQGVDEPELRLVSHPRHIAVGPNQHGGGSSYLPERRQLPRASVPGVDQLHAICPWSDVEASGNTEVQLSFAKDDALGTPDARASGDGARPAEASAAEEMASAVAAWKRRPSAPAADRVPSGSTRSRACGRGPIEPVRHS